MHMADALLSPAVGATFWAATLGTIGYASRRLRQKLDEKTIPLMGVLGAFIFAAQMINFTIPGTGSSGHLGGGMVLAAVVGPHAAFIVMASVLTVQAFFFADGGLLALGCNIWNLGFYPSFIAYPLVFRPLLQAGATRRRITVASLAAGVLGLELGAFSVVLQTTLSGRSELPFGAFSLMMIAIHCAIGLAEGFATAGVLNFVRAARPGVLEGAVSDQPLSPDKPTGRIVAGLLVASLVIGGALSWFASSNPDGLEWSIRKVLGKQELTERDPAVTHALKSVQEKTAVLPDYGFRKPEGEAAQEDRSRGADAGTPVSGVVGPLLVLAAIVLVGALLRLFRGKRHV